MYVQSLSPIMNDCAGKLSLNHNDSITLSFELWPVINLSAS